MEPPSSVNTDQTMTGAPVDDPLSNFFINESYIVVTGFSDEDQESGYVVCGYSPRTGLSYFGITRPSIES